MTAHLSVIAGRGVHPPVDEETKLDRRLAELRERFPGPRFLFDMGDQVLCECRIPGCSRLAVESDICDDCAARRKFFAERNRKAQVQSIERAFRRQERADRRERISKRSLEAWLVVWDWLKANAIDYALLLFIAWALSYLLVIHGLEFHDWLDSLAQ